MLFFFVFFVLSVVKLFLQLFSYSVLSVFFIIGSGSFILFSGGGPLFIFGMENLILVFG